MLMCVLKENTKFVLSGAVALMVFVFADATETVKSGIYYEIDNTAIVGKEYIYINEDTIIYDKEQALIKQNARHNSQEKKTKTKNIANLPADKNGSVNEIEEKPEVEIREFPFSSSSLFFIQYGKESAVVVSSVRIKVYQPGFKAYRENTCSNIDNSKYSLYIPKQRQKTSSAATQCGILTSFSPNSPDFSRFLSST